MPLSALRARSLPALVFAAIALLASPVVRAQDGAYAWREVTPDSLRGTQCHSIGAGRSADGARDLVYALCRPGLLRSDDGGQTWHLVRRQVVRLGVAPGDGERLYAATSWYDPVRQTRSDTLLTSRDGGRTWQSLNAAFAASQRGGFYADLVSRMAVSPLDPNRLLIGGSSRGVVFVSDDGGSTFRYIDFGSDGHHGNILTAVPSGRHADRFHVHAYFREPGGNIGDNLLVAYDGWGRTAGPDVYATGQPGSGSHALLSDTSGALILRWRRTRDGGRTFEPIRTDENEALSVVATSPVNGVAFASRWSAELGRAVTYVSGDAGRRWRRAAPVPPVFRSAEQWYSDYAASPRGDSVLYASGDEGLFVLTRATTVRADEPPSTLAIGLHAAPNPVRGPVSIRIAAPSADAWTLDVVDALGRTWESRTGTGPQTVVWGAAAPPGLYILRLRLDGTSERAISRTVVRRP